MTRIDQMRRPALAGELRRILDEDLVRSVYQPIVDLDDGAIVAYEALARGPAGSPLERADRLFAAAREAGALEELEWSCRAAALRGALAARLGTSLLVNVESSLLDSAVPPGMAALLERAAGELGVVLELTERSLADRPAEMLARVARLRELGCLIALDDVGAHPRSLALMPFVAPEVVKLDLRVVQERPTPEIAAIVHAVNAEAERSGAVLLAEGIETPAQRDVARALGARYGQGWLLGRPGPLPATTARTAPLALPRRRPTVAASPYEAVAAHVPARPATKRLLLAVSRHLEAQVPAQGEAAVVLATFQHARHFTAPTAARYERLAAGAALVAALGVGLDDEPAVGVRGGALAADDPLHGEWDVIVVAPHFPCALVARDLGDPADDDLARRFRFCLTYDRALVVDAARALIGRIAPH